MSLSRIPFCTQPGDKFSRPRSRCSILLSLRPCHKKVNHPATLPLLPLQGSFFSGAPASSHPAGPPIALPTTLIPQPFRHSTGHPCLFVTWPPLHLHKILTTATSWTQACPPPDLPFPAILHATPNASPYAIPIAIPYAILQLLPQNKPLHGCLDAPKIHF